MAKIRQVLIHVSVQTAAAKRKCYRKPRNHQITKGQACLVVREGSAGGRKNYCGACAVEILAMAERDIQSLRRALGQS